MSCLTPPYSEKDISRVVASLREVIAGRSNSTGVVTLTGGSSGTILTFNNIVSGSLYTNGTFNSALQGGSGTGGIGHITVAGNAVTAITIVGGGNGGSGYLVGDTVNAFKLAGTSTTIATVSIFAQGSGYTDGFYPNIPLTGGSGSGATADFTILGGHVTAVDINTPGTGYAVSDFVGQTALPGSGFVGVVATRGGTGFSAQVATTTNVPGTVTVQAPNCAPGCQVFLTPQTLHAAAALPTTYVQPQNVTKGQFIINHGGVAFGDVTFGWDCRG